MNDYLYDSARVRSLENALIGRERIEQLLATKSVEEMILRLNEMGVASVTDAEGRFLREETLLQILRNAYGELSEAIGSNDELKLWLYPYDCNNVKAAIKGFFRKIDPRSMMFDFGTVGVEDVIRMVEEGSFTALPRTMREAAVQAMATYAKQRDPQKIDLLLDCACYADMLAAAKNTPFALDLVTMRIDMTNLLTLVRILRMNSGEAGKMLLGDALIGGGTLAPQALLALYGSGEDAVWQMLTRNERYEGLANTVNATARSLTDVERCIDNFLMARLREAKWVASGAEVLIGFLMAHEYDVKNLRILFASKQAGLPVQTIRERIRESYV